MAKVAAQTYDPAVPLEALHVHPENPRKGDVEAIAESIEVNDFYGSVLAQKSTGYILAGKHRRDAARVKGLPTVPVIYVDVDDDTARRIVLGDNRLSDRATYDDTALAALLRNLKASSRGMAGTGYDPKDVTAVLRRTARRPLSLPDVVPAVPADPVTLPGAVIRLGRHRLVCGDALDPAVRATLLDGRPHADLVLTDPPFAIYGSSSGIAADIADDKMVRPFFRDILRATAETLKLFGHAYVCCDWRSWATWWDMARGSGLAIKNMIVWDKLGVGLGSNYANAHELMVFASRVPTQEHMRSKQTGMRSVLGSNIWRIARVAVAGAVEGREHNAQKPVELMRTAIEHSTDTGELVVDFFGGAGTTLIAAEACGRTAGLIEIDPRYCDVIVRRWEDVTGETAERG